MIFEYRKVLICLWFPLLVFFFILTSETRVIADEVISFNVGEQVLKSDVMKKANIGTFWRDTWEFDKKDVKISFSVPDGDFKFRLGIGVPEERQRVTATIQDSQGNVIDTISVYHRGFKDFLIDLSDIGVEGTDKTELTVHLQASHAPFWIGPCKVVSAAPEHPNILIYLIDTLRLDHMGMYGYKNATTPNLKKFAADSVTFTHLTPSSSHTRPSVASLFSSTYPATHGVHQHHDVMRPDLPSLAEELGNANYQTRGWVANGNATPQHNLGMGFGIYSFIAEYGAADIADAILVDTFLEEFDVIQGGPWYAYVQAVSPHEPYTPPEPFFSAFQEKDTTLTLGEFTKILSVARPDSDETGSLLRASRGLMGLPVKSTLPRGEQVFLNEFMTNGALKKKIEECYDGDILYGDYQFGRVIHDLKARGLYDDTLIIVLSDHGEEFWEHGSFGHGKTLYEELLRVPLIVKLPGNDYKGEIRESLVNAVDIAPTLLDFLGLEPNEHFQGTSFLNILQGEDSEQEPRLGFASLNQSRRNKNLRVVKTLERKYLNDKYANKSFMFDLVKDPDELHPEEVIDTDVRIEEVGRFERYSAKMSSIGAKGVYLVITADLSQNQTVSGSIQLSDITNYNVQFPESLSEVSLVEDTLEFTFEMKEQKGKSAKDSIYYALIYIDCPMDSNIVLSVNSDGIPIKDNDVSLGLANESVTLQDHEVLISELYVPADHIDFAHLPKELQVYAWAIPDVATIGDEELSPEIVENLEALGYLE